MAISQRPFRHHEGLTSLWTLLVAPRHIHVLISSVMICTDDAGGGLCQSWASNLAGVKALAEKLPGTLAGSELAVLR